MFAWQAEGHIIAFMQLREAQQLIGELDALIEDAAKGTGRHVRDVMDDNPQTKRVFNAVHRAADH